MMNSDEFKNEVWEIADRIGVKPKEIHIRKLTTKWASCSAKGRLTFDKSLLNENDKLRLKVIIHELLHLKYPTHGKMFKRVFEAYLNSEIERMK